MAALAGGALAAFGLYKSGKSSEKAAKTIANAKSGGFSSSGLSATPNKEIYSLTRSSDLNGTLNSISGAYGSSARKIGELLAKVSPGISEATNTAVATLRNRRSEAIGNLRENLARRRVMGSSFASDAISRLDREYAQAEAETKANNLLQEIDLSSKLIQQQTTANIGQFQTYLDQMNLEAEVGTQLASGVTATLSSNAQALASLSAQSAQGYGALAGNVLGPSLEALGGKLSTALGLGE